jgi:peptide/nickel transport system substrate-binding protein
MGRHGIFHYARTRVAAAATVAGACVLALPAAAEERPVITVAVQQIVNAGVLDTLREQSNVGSRIFTSIFDTLIQVDRQGDLSHKPGLAESWTRIDDKTIEFKLRKGVKFHNGEEMTAEDVVFSFGPERMWGFAKKGDAPKTGQTLFTQSAGQSSSAPPEVHAVARRLLPGFERMEAVDRYTVRFHNSTPDVTLEGRLTRTGMNVVSKKAFMAAPDWRTFSAAPVATGPYKVKEFKPDNILILEAHDDYWGGKPTAREIRFVVVPEVAGRVNGLISGQYDFITDVPPDQIQTIEASAKHEVVGGPVLNHRISVFDKNHPALKDPRVRRALTLAIDRKLIVDTLWSGRTSIPQGLQWEYYGPMFVSDWQAPAYDPEAARKLLKEAGYNGEPIPYRVLNNYYANQVPTAQILQEMWRAVGANVQIEMKENWQQILAKDSPRAIRDWSNSAAFNDPVSSMVTQHCPRGQQQQVGEWANEEFNKLCTELETSTDQSKRPAMFRRMLEIIEREDPGYTVLHRTVLFYGKRKDIQWKYSPTMAMDFRADNLKIAK